MKDCKSCGAGLELESYQNQDGDVILALVCPDCEKVYPVKDKSQVRKLLNDGDYSRYVPVDVLINLNS